MRNSKRGQRALGLAILGALSLTAFFAGSAQATSLPSLSTPGEFQIELLPALLSTIAGVQEGSTWHKVQGRNLTIECSTGSVTNGKINSGTEALIDILSSGCVAWNFNQTVKLPCTVLTPGEPTGSTAATALMLPILHSGNNFLLLEPTFGALNFTEIELHGATCPLPLVNPVKGTIVAEVVVNDAVKPLITFSPAIQLLAGTKLSFGGFSSYLDADFELELSGHPGYKLAIV